MKLCIYILLVLLCYENGIAQPVGGEIYFYLFDKKGKSLFSHQDTLLWFDNQHENKSYKITITGKIDMYGIYFAKNASRLKTLGYKVQDERGEFSVHIFSEDSLSICITDKRNIFRKMVIHLPAIQEGKPYYVYANFRRKRIKITKEQIENLKKLEPNKGFINLSPYFMSNYKK